MQLIDYIKPMNKAELDDFAKRCETSAGQLRHVATGFRRCGENLAINIDRESGGEVTCEELRPDCDWAHIRGTKKKTA